MVSMYSTPPQADHPYLLAGWLFEIVQVLGAAARRRLIVVCLLSTTQRHLIQTSYRFVWRSIAFYIT